MKSKKNSKLIKLLKKKVSKQSKNIWNEMEKENVGYQNKIKHTTHYDDCGCISNRYKKRILELEKECEELRSSKLESKQQSNQNNQNLEDENAEQDIENKVNIERQGKLVLKVEELERKLIRKTK